jgi:penicillin G amidase
LNGSTDTSSNQSVHAFLKASDFIGCLFLCNLTALNDLTDQIIVNIYLMKTPGFPNLLQFLLALFITGFVLVALNTKISSVPPLGKFLDPARGIWQTATIAEIPEVDQLTIPGLRAPVKVLYNDRGVPHIFAENDHDLYLAQGYVVARHRLWQMEFSTHAAAGRISEIIGEQALGYDRHQRKIGMTYGARNIMEAINEDETTKLLVQAYSDGVNAWINELDPKTMPFEYKLLDYSPEAWSPYKTAIFIMNMNQTLSFRTDTYALTRLRDAMGVALTQALFPDNPEIREPIISEDRVWDFTANLPEPPATAFIPRVTRDEFGIPEADPNIGSNNWAVSGTRTASGYPLLASDPHLTLSLPSIWYEIQLNAPGINTYGVTFPGTPGIVIGFNESISWGVTNTGGFALDLFEIKLSEDKATYFHDGEWKPIRHELESYTIRGGETRIDTMYFTHHGPITYLKEEYPDQLDSTRVRTYATSTPVGHALQWIAHQASNPVKTMYLLNRATNFEEFETAVSHFESPAQNFAFASHDGDIAMKISGRHPVRWVGQGKYISDGSDIRYDWTEYIPHTQVPWERNPNRGYVSSANQELAGTDYPYFIGQRYASPARAILINQTLDSLPKATPQDMIALQMNSDNYWAQSRLDAMLAGIDRTELTDEQLNLLNRLSTWDRTNSTYSPEALFFNGWLYQVQMVEFAGPLLKLGSPVSTPSMLTVFSILFGEADTAPYVQLYGSEPDLNAILTKSFVNAYRTLSDAHGTDIDTNWSWWNVNGSTIHHLLNVPALNLPRLEVSGSSYSPNAIRRDKGPSWRMVVEMSRPVRAWGVYPGGQSGNPASPNYNAFIERWANGQPFELILFPDVTTAASQLGKTVILSTR